MLLQRHHQTVVPYPQPLNSRSAQRIPLGVAEPEEYYHTAFDKTYGVEWVYLKATSPVRFTRQLVAALRKCQRQIEGRARRALEFQDTDRVCYQVFASRIPKVFSLGGDLDFFAAAVRSQDREALTAYARECIGLVYWNAVNYELPLTTISLVQGTALGGGFEAALAANVVVAERQSRMGFPEVLLNMFPGMGAYPLLTRRLTPVQAERLILSGRVYGAEELHEMGLVDVLADDGRGEEAVWNYVKQHHRQARGAWGLRRAIQATSPIRYESLRAMVAIWVDTVLALDERDLKRMDYLVRAHRSA